MDETTKDYIKAFFKGVTLRGGEKIEHISFMPTQIGQIVRFIADNGKTFYLVFPPNWTPPIPADECKRCGTTIDVHMNPYGEFYCMDCILTINSMMGD